MTETEIEFLEVYKRFDRLCADMLGVNEGVSLYIAECESLCSTSYARQADVEDDYYTLKHLRYIRNKITHDSEFSGCTDDDLSALRNLYSRFLAVDDPLSRVRKFCEPNCAEPEISECVNEPIAEDMTEEKTLRRRKFIKFLLVVLSLGALGISVFWFVYFLLSGGFFGV